MPKRKKDKEKLLERKKELIIMGILLILIIPFSSSDTVQQGIIPPPQKYDLGGVTTTSIKIIQHKYECGGCLQDEKCYNIGTRLEHLYCSNNKNFMPQKITNEICENDFECQSDKCSNNKCGQKQGIKIIKLYKNEGVLIQNLIFKQNENFYFDGFDENYSIRLYNPSGLEDVGNDLEFAKDAPLIPLNNSHNGLLIIINNKFIVFRNNKFILDDNTQFILNSIILNNSVAYANVTFIESKNPIDDVQNLIDELLGDKGTFAPIITGGVIETQKENFFDKIIGFFKRLFSKK